MTLLQRVVRVAWPSQHCRRGALLSGCSTIRMSADSRMTTPRGFMMRIGRRAGSRYFTSGADGAAPRRDIHRSFSSSSLSSPNASRTVTIAILRETYDPWERRAPLTPDQVKHLLCLHNNVNNKEQLQVWVQPSGLRVFSDRLYQQAGAVVKDDVTGADLLLGVKRPSADQTLHLPNNATYLFFSHTVKGQPENMALLADCMDKRIQLMDYEKLLKAPPPTNETSSATSASTQRQERLVSFGRYAGLAAAIDSFSALGRRLLLTRGLGTPFLSSCPPTLYHDSLHQAKERVLELGERLQRDGISSSLSEPLVFAVTGGMGGTVHRGVKEILKLLPHQVVAVDDLPSLFEKTNDRHQFEVYLCPVATQDVFAKHSSSSSSTKDDFDMTDYLERPDQYRSLFATKVAPYATVLYNCVYWDERFPRLLTKAQMRRLYETGQDRLLLLADVSCDVHGSIEFLERTTSIERPFFQYDPIAGREVDTDIGPSGITVMGVDILPTELPKESSEHFGNALVGVVEELIHAKQKQPEGMAGIDPELLPPHLTNACITTVDGKLTHAYRYLEPLMNRVPRTAFVPQKTMVLSLEGHLFDSGLINQILDVIENYQCGVDFQQCLFCPPTSSSTTSKADRQMSSVLLRVNGSNESVLDQVELKIRALVDLIENAQATLARVDHGRSGGDRSPKSQVTVEDSKEEKRVLLLGAGMVSKSLVDLLGRGGRNVITVVSDKTKEAQQVAEAAKKGYPVAFDVANDHRRLVQMIDDTDLVVSLLPSPMHPRVAAECVTHRKDLVTASYESEEMRFLSASAQDAGIIILNEVGLDPGLDHMSAMKIINEIKARGGTVTGFSSVCGGLPSPEAANNPLKYKFSWSPQGVIRASQNDARYRWEGRIVEVHGDELLQNAAPFVAAWPDLHLECLPNRDSLHYENIYSIEGANTIFRGTLRYRGFSSLMNVFKNMGLFDELELGALEGGTWQDVVNLLRTKRGGFHDLDDFMRACAEEDADDAQRAMETLRWLGVLNGGLVPKSGRVVDAFCEVLEEKLRYGPGERDMVVMHHAIDALFEDGTEERHHSSLQVFGDDSCSAMAKTVGYTAAAAADLVLGGQLSGEHGLLLPTTPRVYEPILHKVGLEGISFNESVDMHPSLDSQKHILK